MKLLIIPMLIFSFSFPAMATSEINQSLEIENLDSDQMLDLYQLQDDAELMADDEKALYRCYARPNAFFYRHYRYYATGFNRRFAAVRAIRTCRYNLRRMNYFASRYGCSLSYCIRYFK